MVEQNKSNFELLKCIVFYSLVSSYTQTMIKRKISHVYEVTISYVIKISGPVVGVLVLYV